MEDTLKEINSLVQNKTIKKYAIGGAIASTFYIEPVSTFDLEKGLPDLYLNMNLIMIY